MTSTELVPVGGTQVEVRHQEFTGEEIALIKDQIAPNATDGELALFVRRCETSGLDPFAGQIHCIIRGRGNNRKMSIQTGIDGYRLIAHRTGLDDGQEDPEWCDADGRWHDHWIGDTRGASYQRGEWPSAARVKVWKKGVNRPYVGVATWWEYAQWVPEYRNGQKTGRKVLGPMWLKMGAHMLAKCAEAIALRKAFPAELSGLYTEEEMAQSAMAREFKRKMVEGGGYEVLDEAGRPVGTVDVDDQEVKDGFMRDSAGNVVPDPSTDQMTLGANPEDVEAISARARALPDPSRQRSDMAHFIQERGLDLRDPTTVPRDMIPVLKRKLTTLEKQLKAEGEEGTVEPDGVAMPAPAPPAPEPDADPVIEVCETCGNPTSNHVEECPEGPEVES